MKHYINLLILILLSSIFQMTVNAEVITRPEIVWNGIWFFTLGVSNLSDTLPSGQAIRFRLNGNEVVDLDTLLPVAGKVGDEGVLFTEFDASRDGEAVIGIGCDWWFQLSSMVKNVPPPGKPVMAQFFTLRGIIPSP